MSIENINVYNILCDSVGMTAMPNNGTLHLPLKITGLHDPDAALEEPADPVPVETSPEGEIATGTTSDPQTEATENAQPSSTVGVDPVVEKPEEQSPPSDDDNKSSGSWWESTWDWVKDTFDGLIDSVKGIGKGSS